MANRFIMAGIAAVGLAAAFASDAAAGLQFQSDFPTYTASGNGTVQATVKVYVVETAGTTTITSGGGLNSAAVRVISSTPTANDVQITSIAGNINYTGQKTGTTSTGQLLEEMADLTSGVAAESPTKYLLGTYTLSGLTAGGQAAKTTTFTIMRYGTGQDYIYTKNTPFGPYDSTVQTGTFTVTVPEPSAAVAGVGGLGLLLARRRRAALR